MAGHSHWANIAQKKGVADAKRGKVFSKLSRYIIIAARHGGGDPDTNLKLRYAIDKARSVSMPRENIERAVKRGTGELAGETLEELQYEGFGPGGVALICDVVTDNRNRTFGELRKIFERGGGSIGISGSVAYLFKRKGVILIDKRLAEEDAVMSIVLEAGADDLKVTDDHYEVICTIESFNPVQEALTQAKIATNSAELTQIADIQIDADIETGLKVLKLMENLDDHDDVNAVHSNLNLTDEIAAAIG